jgi:hypothetical protein
MLLQPNTPQRYLRTLQSPNFLTSGEATTR